MNRIGWLALLFLLLLSRLIGMAAGRDETRRQAAAEELFRDGLIPEIQIRIPSAALDQLRQHPRTYVSATIREGKVTYTNVQIRLKGGPGSFRQLDDQPAFTVNFGKEAEGQKFHGLKKLHLNNSVQDRNYLSEKISRELFEAAGVPAPRAAHAIVEVNGRPLGLYVLIEGIDKHFLKRYFADTEGNLYDGHSGSDVTRGLRTNSGENRRDHTGLAALAAAALEPDLDARLAALNRTLDVERFLSFLAVEVMINHWDGYTIGRNNYRIYHDRAKNRMVFLPQGVDQVFQNQRQSTSIFPPAQGLVARSVLEIPELRMRYRERMAQLLTNVFQVPAVTRHLMQVGTNVQAALAKVDPDNAAGYLSRVAGFGRRIQQRVNTLERQLLAPRASVKMETSGTVPLPTWEPQVDLGSPSVTKESTPDGKTLLHISAREHGAGSWRTWMVLAPGHYQLAGKLKLQGVHLAEDDSKAGVGFRISRRKFPQKLTGDVEWTAQAFEFDVTDEPTEVELVCELRAAQGEVWFDLGSLRLTRTE